MTVQPATERLAGHPNYTHVDMAAGLPDGRHRTARDLDYAQLMSLFRSNAFLVWSVTDLMRRMCRLLFEMPETRDLVDGTAGRFDAVVMESGVRRRAAPAAGRARRVRGAVLACQLDARGHRDAAQPVVPGLVAHRPADARHVPRPSGQRARVRAHRAGAVVPRHGLLGPRHRHHRRPVRGRVPGHRGTHQHAPLGRTGPAHGAQRRRGRWHSPAARGTGAPSKLCTRRGGTTSVRARALG